MNVVYYKWMGHREKATGKWQRANNHWWDEEYLVRKKIVKGTLLDWKSRKTAINNIIIDKNKYNGLEELI
jgi:hypothetical protein